MFDVIAPIFAIVLLGYSFARLKIFSASTAQGLTNFMFYVAIPAMLFRSISVAELPASIPWTYLLAFYIPSFIVFASGMLCSKLFFNWEKNEQGIAGVCSAYSNMVLLGLPLLLAAYGAQAILPLFILLAPQSLLLFPATVLSVEIYGKKPSADRDTHSTDLLKSLSKLILNPIVISLLLGITVNISGLSLFLSLDKALKIIGDAAPACALTALGVSLGQYQISRIGPDSILLAMLKNFLHPVLVFGACSVFEITPFWTQIAVFLAAMPCGINAFIFASSYGLRTSAVTQSIVISTIVATGTASCLLVLFQ